MKTEKTILNAELGKGTKYQSFKDFGCYSKTTGYYGFKGIL